MVEPGGFSGENDFFTPDLSNFLLARGFETSYATKSAEVEFITGPAGGPYTVAAKAPRSDETVWMAQSRDGSTAVLKSEDHDLAGMPTGTTQGSTSTNGGRTNSTSSMFSVKTPQSAPAAPTSSTVGKAKGKGPNSASLLSKWPVSTPSPRTAP